MVMRPFEYDRLVNELVDQFSFGPVAISTALPGARGFGKTSLAAAICQDPRVIESFPDGVFWVNLANGAPEGGLSKLELIRRIDTLLIALTGQPSGLVSLEDAVRRLREVMHPRSLLLVLEDAADAATLEHFLHTGPTGACLIVTCRPECLPLGARAVTVDAMLPGEAELLLAAGLVGGGEEPPADETTGAKEEPPAKWERLTGPAEEVDPLLAGLPASVPGDSVLAGPGVMAALHKAENKKRVVDAGIPPEAAEPLLNLSMRLNSWPLLLALVNGMLVGPVSGEEDGEPRLPEGFNLVEQVAKAAGALAGLAEHWKINEQAGRDQALDGVLAACLEAFPPAERERYRELAVFPADEAIPLAAVCALWRAAGLQEEDARRLAARFANHRLVEPGVETGTLLVLGAVHERIRAGMDAAAITGLHQRLVETYHARIPAGWHGGPDDGYFFRRLPHHLVKAGRRGELQALLFNFSWLSAFCSSRFFCPGDLYLLLEQYDLALSTALDRQSASLRLVREALLMSLPMLAVERSQLAAQLLGRLLIFDDPDIRTMMAQAGAWGERSWLRPLSACFPAPGSGEVRVMSGHNDWVSCVAVLPDGRFALSGSLDGSICVWDLSVGQVVREYAAHKGGVLALAAAPDGLSAASAGMDGKIRVWDLNSGEQKLEMRGHKKPVSALVINPTNDTLISASDDHTICVWDLFSGDRMHEYKGHAEPVCALALTPDGQSLISGSLDNSVRIWDLANEQQLHALTGHTGWVRSVTVSPDGFFALTGGWDGVLRVWDLWTGEEVLAVDHFRAPVFSIAVTPDQKTLLAGTGDGRLHLLDFATGEEKLALSGHQGGINGLAITSSGRFAITAADDHTLRIWDLFLLTGGAVAAGERLQAMHGKDISSVEILPGGQYGLSASADGTLKLWELSTAQEVGVLAGHSGEVLALAVDSSGQFALSGARDCTARLWNLPERQEARALRGHSAPVTAVAITPDGRLGATGDQSGALTAWDLQTGSILGAFRGDSAITALRITPDGQTILASGAGGRMFFLRVAGQDGPHG